MSRFDADTALEPAGEGRWAGELAEGWDTPRGPLGGYVMAIVLRGLALAVDDEVRSPRSVTMHFLRVPEVGPVEVHAQVERAGRSLTSVSARLEQDGKLLGIAIGAYSKPWDAPELPDAPAPEVDPPQGRESIGGPGGRAEPPPFLQRLTMQPRFGAAPFAEAPEGLTGGWLGLREERPIDELALAVLADAWFPAPWPRLAELHPAPTIDLTIHFRMSLPLPDGLLLGRFHSRAVHEGFFDEDGELWTPGGSLVAQSRQLALLLPPLGS